MTVIVPFGRVFTRHAFSKSNHVLTRLATSNSLLRASCGASDSTIDKTSRHGTVTGSISALVSRAYASTATSKPASRPKAHTGRATTKKATGKGKQAATKKQPAKKTAKKAKAKAKPALRSRTKRPPSKAALSQARVSRKRSLKEKALLTEPKRLPENVWVLYLREHRGEVRSLAENAQALKDLSHGFRNITPEEREKLNHTSNQNKAKNHAEYQQWLKTYTPAQIKAANNARRLLSKEKKEKDGKKKSQIPLIKDERLVKQPKNAYSIFVQDRHSSGDFKHMTLTEASSLIAREWKALSASDKAPYNDKSAAEKRRYREEASSVYGV